MRINADFSKTALVLAPDSEWICSPESGVDRIMLDRIGDEVARATSIVRYAAASSFSRHEHAKGEEFLVLDGVFSDDTGDFPAGSYVRNPPGSSHSPYSKEGCRILVKLRQFDPQDLEQVVVDTRDASLWQAQNGVDVLSLHSFGNEQVFMLRIAEGRQQLLDANNHGIEIFVVEGTPRVGDQALPPESWLRMPADTPVELQADSACLLWVKCGHLPD